MGDGQRLAANLVMRSKTSELLESGDDQGSQRHKTSQFYRPLDNYSNEIRLLKVSPGFGSDMISCTLACPCLPRQLSNIPSYILHLGRLYCPENDST
jgi:hypothetical protein